MGDKRLERRTESRTRNRREPPGDHGHLVLHARLRPGTDRFVEAAGPLPDVTRNVDQPFGRRGPTTWENPEGVVLQVYVSKVLQQARSNPSP
jgi:hypothetical protein